MPVELYSRDTGSGPCVLLLHAFPLSSAMWLSQREALSASWRVVTPDQRGFGGSPLGDDLPALDLAADDLAALLDAKAVDRAIVSGLSMGGYVAMAFWRRHADRVAALVLADTKAAADAEPARQNRRRIASLVEAEPDSTVLIDEVFPTLIGPTTREQRPLVAGRVRGFVQSAPSAAVAWAQRAMAERPDSFDTLASVDVPTLVVVGEEDELAPPTDAMAMTEAISGARLRRIADAGHLPAVERPAEFNAVLVDFLASLG